LKTKNESQNEKSYQEKKFFSLRAVQCLFSREQIPSVLINFGRFPSIVFLQTPLRTETKSEKKETPSNSQNSGCAVTPNSNSSGSARANKTLRSPASDQL
jgi:hypothetical protein